MSLSSEIRKVHNELYKTVNGNIRVLLPIALSLLDKFKAKAGYWFFCEVRNKCVRDI